MVRLDVSMSMGAIYGNATDNDNGTTMKSNLLLIIEQLTRKSILSDNLSISWAHARGSSRTLVLPHTLASLTFVRTYQMAVGSALKV